MPPWVGVALKTTLSPWQIVVAEALMATTGVHADGAGPVKQIPNVVILKAPEALNTLMKYVCPITSELIAEYSPVLLPF